MDKFKKRHPISVRTTENLMSGLRNRDVKTFEYLYDKHKKIVVKRLKNKNASKEEIEDAYNECFEKILKLADSGKLPEIKDFKAYIIKSCYNNFLNNRLKEKQTTINFDLLIDEAPDDIEEQELFLAIAYEKIAKLSERDREIINNGYSNLSREEVLDKHNLTKQKYYSIKKELRIKLTTEILKDYETNRR